MCTTAIAAPGNVRGPNSGAAQRSKRTRTCFHPLILPSWGYRGAPLDSTTPPLPSLWQHLFPQHSISVRQAIGAFWAPTNMCTNWNQATGLHAFHFCRQAVFACLHLAVRLQFGCTFYSKVKVMSYHIISCRSTKHYYLLARLVGIQAGFIPCYYGCLRAESICIYI